MRVPVVVCITALMHALRCTTPVYDVNSYDYMDKVARANSMRPYERPGIYPGMAPRNDLRGAIQSRPYNNCTGRDIICYDGMDEKSRVSAHVWYSAKIMVKIPDFVDVTIGILKKNL